MSKLRVDLRLYAELISAGIFGPKEGLPLLGKFVIVLYFCVFMKLRLVLGLS